ncbi:LysR substrate-binding domain-containing protein [Verminephrobacter eiseniae]|uniref:LysR substrate-binding domain-containing protein n=1 Tax=Verminephrobacter eiseniae TaxID=364317 RepID=UPI0010DDAB2B|nr:LysR substrate-binding domain-containing protein [Verminephrobacter eiseniae]KAB7591304.1 LysR family transcriptional regulator [Verminephrobacter sp. Larva24]MCW5231500.1 LysR family transcriptional regulator [Verminephrobacter eiseniae]MCW5293229.1 LysR family transcriptional regulator [Verminephrobacter eiseniae]MCW8186603.1 LysR family transcriptional regulator [Verminephrobacter eiseniae]MCW8225060.1 LysR family transcriptional regulator [Verminephrobacter eiseniae]
MIELQKLHYFVTVAQTLNVGKAATLLHISQSPLSRQIIALEERLGTALFSRERKRLQLTDAGRQFLDEAKALIEHAQQLEDRIRDEAQGRTGAMTLGFVEGAIHVGALQTAIKRFLNVAPQARIELKNLRSRQQFEALQFGGIDVGFTYSPPVRSSTLVAEQIADEGFAVAMPRNHPLAQGRFDPRKLDGEAFIALPEKDSPEARLGLMGACASAGFIPNVRFEAAEPSVVLGLVNAGVGLAIVQQSLGKTPRRGIVLRPLPSSFPMRAQIFRVTRKTVRPLVARFLGSQKA